MAGTSLPLNRARTAELLGFPAYTRNSIDAVSDRDFLAELCFCCAMVGVHLSRWAEDWIIYSTTEFAFIELTKDGGIAASNKHGSSVFLNAADKSVLVVSEHGHSISMTADALTLADKDGNVISIDKGAVTVLSTGDVNVRGPVVNIGAGSVFLGDPAAFKAVLGELLVAYLGAHTHGTGLGPSTPPIVPPPPTILSESVKVKK